MLDHVAGDLLLELLHIVGHLRPGAHQAHVPPEHIEKLGQLVDGALADKRAEGRLAGVPVPAPAGFFRIVDPHGTKLVHIKRLLVPAHPLLPEEDGARRGQLHPHRRHEHQGGRHHNQHQGTHDVHGALQKRVGQIVQGNAAQIDDRQAVDIVHLGVRGHIGGVEGHQRQLGAGLFAQVDELSGEGELIRRYGQDHLVGVALLQDGLQLVVAAQQIHSLQPPLVRHVAIHGVAQLPVGPHFAHIGRSHGTVSHHQHMLLVVAQAPVVPQGRSQRRPLAHQHPIGQHAKRHQHPPGHLVEAEHKQRGNQDQRVQHRGQEQRLRLPVEPHRPVGGVQSRHSIGAQAQHHRRQSQPNETAEGERDSTGEEMEPDPVGQQHGRKHQHAVAEHVELIQQPLIFLDHSRFSPFFNKNPASFYLKSNYLSNIIGHVSH